MRKRVRQNRAVLNLTASTYKVRVAGLNKFGKPGVWSDWLKVSVASSSKGVVRLGGGDGRTDKPKTIAGGKVPIALTGRNLNAQPESMALAYARRPVENPNRAVEKPAPKAAVEKRVKPSKKEKTESYQSDFWSLSTLVPGLPQMQRGDTGMGAFYMGLAGALGGFVISRGASADSIASQPGNNALLMSALLAGQSQQSVFVARELRADASAAYDARVQEQRLGFGFLALVYIWHLVDVAFWQPSPTISARRGGIKQPRRTYGVNLFADGENNDGRRAEFRFSLKF